MRLNRIINSSVEEGELSPEFRDAVVLIGKAVNVQGGRRLFTSRNYSEFTMVDGTAVELFNYFTINNK